MDFKDTGTYAYSTAIALCLYSAGAFGKTSMISAGIIGTLLSSPSDMQGMANEWRVVSAALETFNSALDNVEKQVKDDDWHHMSRPDFQASKQAFLDRAANAKTIYHGMSDTDSGMATLSLALAAFCLTGATTLAACASWVYLSRAMGATIGAGVAAAFSAQAAGNAVSESFRKMLVSAAWKSRKALLAGAAIGGIATFVLSRFADAELRKASTPHDPAPDFSQVVLRDLPLKDDKGQDLKPVQDLREVDGKEPKPPAQKNEKPA